MCSRKRPSCWPAKSMSSLNTQQSSVSLRGGCPSSSNRRRCCHCCGGSRPNGSELQKSSTCLSMHSSYQSATNMSMTNSQRQCVSLPAWCPSSFHPTLSGSRRYDGSRPNGSALPRMSRCLKKHPNHRPATSRSSPNSLRPSACWQAWFLSSSNPRPCCHWNGGSRRTECGLPRLSKSSSMHSNYPSAMNMSRTNNQRQCDCWQAWCPSNSSRQLWIRWKGGRSQNGSAWPKTNRCSMTGPIHLHSKRRCIPNSWIRFESA